MKIRWLQHESLLATMLAVLAMTGILWDRFVLGRVPYPEAPWPDIGLILLIFGAYLILNQSLVPFLAGLKSPTKNSRFGKVYVRLMLLFLAVGMGLYIIMYFKHPRAQHSLHNLLGAYLATALGFAIALLYIAIRAAILFKIARSGPRRNYYALVCNQFTAFAVIYITIPFVVAVFRVIHDGEPVALYFSLTMPVFLVYMVNTYWVFPLKSDQRSFDTATIFRIAASTFVCSIPFLLAPFHEGAGFGFLGCWIGQMLVTTPLTWILYQWRKDKILQLRGVETALAKSTGDLQLLRSQINPHFLFNSLNTLYGFAIREHAGLTSQGIQRLGDMMRFMLEENTKDSIPVEREIEYLHNYMSLQKMRIDPTSDIVVEEQINVSCKRQQIAPMLLIPFVENAFKHGISLDHRSWIRLRLDCTDSAMVFELRNSIHAGQGNDPEKDKGGIGNKNVVQRLGLIYPSRHHLAFTITDTEYIVNLTVNFK